MNPKFFALPEEKRRAIFNAGCRVFARNDYKKSPMSEIADAAGISKSLLFHYFRNKKELYLYLLEACARITAESVRECYGQEDIFEMMRSGLRTKAELMRRYPDMSSFALRAYYEKDPEVRGEVQTLIEKYVSFQTNGPRLKLDPERFVPGLDLRMMYQDMIWAGEGYLWEWIQRGDMDVERMEREFARLIDFWRSTYLRRED